MKALFAAITVLSCLAALALPASADDAAVVCNVKVLSDKVKDISSLEAWKKSYIEGKKTDAERALACWETVVTYQHQQTPPNEFLQKEECVLDPIKLFNVYGYSLCSVAAAEVCQLARVAGLKPRGWTINCHCIMEIEHEDGWHMYDASLINYFPKADGKIAGVREICDAVQGWLKEHPEVCKPNTNSGDDAKLREYGWRDTKTAWKKFGPDLTSRCPFYNERGWWPAGTHGWYSTMQEYDGSNKTPYAWESASTLGYQVNIQLRPGEKLVRNWSNKGLHVNMDGAGGSPSVLKEETGKDALKYTPKYGDLSPGRIGNGTLEYVVPVGDATLKASAWAYEGLQVVKFGGQNVLAQGAADKPGVLIVRMPSSYVYLTGKIDFKPEFDKADSRISVSFSDNNGLDWKPLAAVTQKGAVASDPRVKAEQADAAGKGTVTLNISPLAFRRYDYLVRFELAGQSALCGLTITHDVQHSQRPLPALDQGDNTITFSAGPQEGTITAEGSLNAGAKGKGLAASDFKPTIDGLNAQFQVTGENGSITFPVEAPGAITGVRAGCFFQAWSPEDGFDIEVSYDGGKTFKPVKTFGKSERFNFVYADTKEVPSGVKSALVRFAGTKKNTVQMHTFHVNVDYKQPGAGFAPVKVTYVWDEDGKEKTDVHTAAKPSDTWTIRCASKPVMKSITLELAK